MESELGTRERSEWWDLTLTVMMASYDNEEAQRKFQIPTTWRSCGLAVFNNIVSLNAKHLINNYHDGIPVMVGGE